MSKSFSPSKVFQVFSKTDNKCWYCGKELGQAGSVIEHATPVSRGGTNHIDNLLPSCSSCNSKKRSRNVEEFREYLELQDPCFKALGALEKVCEEMEDLDNEDLRRAQDCLWMRIKPVKFYGETLGR